MVKLLILDVDGVMTDGRKYYDREGNVKMKTFCDKDWTAIKRFRALGIKVIFLTGDSFNVSIAENRHIDVIVNRTDNYHRDKSSYLVEICREYGVMPNEIAYVGDDIFDINIMNSVKYKYCPADAPDEVCKVAQVIPRVAGDNVVAELFDTLVYEELLPKFDFQEHLNKVYELDMKEKF